MSDRRQTRAHPGAHAAALRWLARRPLTVEELRLKLEKRGFGADETESALRRLRQERLIDDEALALHYIAVRSERLGHGRDRLLRDLAERGVERATAERAWDEAVEQGSVEPERLLARQVSRRLEREGGRLDLGGYRRVYNALLRAGFEAQAIKTQLKPHCDFSDGGNAVVSDGLDHDLP